MVLIRHLAEQRRDETSGGEARQVRLESDADLVQVVTVHKSKGLEYPLVCLPFAAHRRSAASGPGRSRALRLPRAGGGQRLVLEPQEADLALADAERLAEDMRLLYVALTRARHGVWVGLSALRVGQGNRCVWHESAIWRLLSGAQPIEAEQLPAKVQAIASQVPGVAVEQTDAIPPTPHAAALGVAADSLPPLRPDGAYHASFDRSWSVGSYTALVRDARSPVEVWEEGIDAAMVSDHSPGVRPNSMTSEADGFVDDREAPLGLPVRLREDEAREMAAAADAGEPDHARPSAASATGVAPWHGFPRGALPGNFLPDQLEWLAGVSFALGRDATLAPVLERRCARAGWGHRSGDVGQWLQRVFGTPLDALGAGGRGPPVALQALQGTAAELEFWLPSAGLRAAEVDALCRRLEVDNSGRSLHGALLDAQLLAEVYVRVTRGQHSLLGEEKAASDVQGEPEQWAAIDVSMLRLPVIEPSESERAAQVEPLERGVVIASEVFESHSFFGHGPGAEAVEVEDLGCEGGHAPRRPRKKPLG